MSDRERRLRERIDHLTDELDKARRRTPKPPPQPKRNWCCYCGAPTKGRVCRGHADLEEAG
jgi:hypothetical protein